MSTLASLYTETPIIVNKTGGLTRQLINPYTLKTNGIGLDPDVTTISGTQEIHYLNEDYVKVEKISKSLIDMYLTSKSDRDYIGKECRKYALKEFSYKNMIRKWDVSLQDIIKVNKQNK